MDSHARSEVVGMWRSPHFCVLSLFVVGISHACAQEQLWLEQFGTVEADSIAAAAPGSSNSVFVAGRTRGNLGGPNAGNDDAFIAKYDRLGNQIWVRQIGTSEDDSAVALLQDGAGGVFVLGNTLGKLVGFFIIPQEDGWVARYDGEGNQLWIEQFGLNGGDEHATSIAPDGWGGVYIGGYAFTHFGRQNPNTSTADAFIVRYDDEGDQLWLRQFGTPSDDIINAVSLDGSGGMIAGGSTTGDIGWVNAGGEDAFLVRYDSDGNRTWARQFGSSESDGVSALSPVALRSGSRDGGAVVAGWTKGDLAAPNAGVGTTDIFMARFDRAGTWHGVGQDGSSENDRVHALMPTTSSGFGVFVVGSTEGSLGGPNAGGTDAFLASGGQSGLDGVFQFGTLGDDATTAIASDGAGGEFIAGFTGGDLGGPNIGATDAYLTRFAMPCYADCDTSTGRRVLDIFDFLCFQSALVRGDPYACECDIPNFNCDLFDFLCFQSAFVVGCP